MLDFIKEDNRLLCKFQGSLRASVCGELEVQLKEAVRDFDGEVAFDLEAVEFVSSGFLRLCLSTGKSTGLDKFSIINVRPLVKKVFMISGLGRLLG